MFSGRSHCLLFSPPLRYAINCFQYNAKFTLPVTTKRFIGAKAVPVEVNSDSLTFNFPEEPLGLPASSTFGFFQGGRGDVLGPSDRYLLRAKLGYGVGSSVWLAKDTEHGSYVALKILSGYSTILNQEEKLRELIGLQRLAALPVEQTMHCTRLLNHFYQSGVEEDGDHLCIALRLEQGSLKDVWDQKQGLPMPTVKRIVRHILHGLSALHSCGIVHTDLKPGNFMIALPAQVTPETLDDWVTTHPGRVYAPIQSLYKNITNAFVSENLPLPSIEDLAHCEFRLGDISHSQVVDDQTTNDITPLTLRPPEVMLGGEWTESVDIWTLGALVFTLMTGRRLFSTSILEHHKQFLREGVTSIDTSDQVVEVLMWQIRMFTGLGYPLAALEIYPLSWRFFQKDGSLKSFRTYVTRPIEICMRDAGFVGSDDDVSEACAFMRRCLQINPMARPSAKALLEDTWLHT